MNELSKATQMGNFHAAWGKWGVRTAAPRSLSPTGTVRRVDVTALMGDTLPQSFRAAQRVLDAIGDALRQILTGYGEWWAPAPGIIEINYGTLSAVAVDLKHSIIVGAVERALRDTLRDALRRTDNQPAAATTVTSYRVDADTFDQLCVKFSARPDQIHTIDIGQALFGDAKSIPVLVERTWAKVYPLLDQFFAHGGYVARQPPRHLRLFFPGLSRSMGEAKCKAIVHEITRALSRRLEEADTEQKADIELPRAGAVRAAAAPQAGAARAIRINPTGRPGPSSKQIDAEAAELNRVVSALAAKRDAALEDWERAAKASDEAWWEMGPHCDVRASEMWCASTRMVCGQVLEPVRNVDGTWKRCVAEGLPNDEWLDHFVLRRATQKAADALARSSTSLIIVPVQWHQLDIRQSRTRYFDICASQPEAVRRLLVLELFDIPEDIIASRVEERVRQLRRMCRTVICRVRLSGRNFYQMGSAFIHAAGVHLSDESNNDNDIYEAMNRFAASCERVQVKLFVHGVHRRKQLLPALAAGAEYISGSVIPTSQGTRPGIRQLSVYELLGGADGDRAQPPGQVRSGALAQG